MRANSVANSTARTVLSFAPFRSGRGAARLAHQSGGLGVVGSNPAAPTSHISPCLHFSWQAALNCRLWEDLAHETMRGDIRALASEGLRHRTHWNDARFAIRILEFKHRRSISHAVIVSGDSQKQRSRPFTVEQCSHRPAFLRTGAKDLAFRDIYRTDRHVNN